MWRSRKDFAVVCFFLMSLNFILVQMRLPVINALNCPGEACLSALFLLKGKLGE